MTAKEQMKNGRLFCFADDMMAEQTACLERVHDYNRTRPSEGALRAKLLKTLFAEVGDGCYFEPPLHANWGIHTHVGRRVYANFNLTLVDDTDIFIGDDVMFGPNVVLATAGHPIEPERRRKKAQFNLPVRIGDNVWLGANVVVAPGVTIGANTVVGAGSVVTRDLPADVVALGSPCRVARPIGERDRLYYYKDRVPG